MAKKIKEALRREEYHEEAVQADAVHGPAIMNSTIVGVDVKWDSKATEAVLIVAQALCNLTELFKAQNIEVSGPLVQINAPKK